jgi:hypothetical protein
VIQNALIEYAGQSATTRSNIFVDNDGELTLNDTRIENSNNFGLRVSDDGSGGGVVLGCNNVTYANNADNDFEPVGSQGGANVAAGCKP